MKKIFKKFSPKIAICFFAILTFVFLALFVIAQVNAHNYRYQWQTCICKYNQVIDFIGNTPVEKLHVEEIDKKIRSLR